MYNTINPKIFRLPQVKYYMILKIIQYLTLNIRHYNADYDGKLQTTKINTGNEIHKDL